VQINALNNPKIIPPMATIYKRRECWYIQWRDTKQRKKSLGEISDHLANVKLKQKEFELASGYEAAKTSGGILFKDYANDYLAWYQFKYPSSYMTIESIVIKSLGLYFDDKQIHSINSLDIERFSQEKIKTIKPPTINRQLSVLNAMLNRAKRHGYLTPEIIIDKVPDHESRPPKFYTREELHKIYKHDDLHKNWWILLANTGMRLGEFYNLKTADINSDSIYIMSSSDARTKSRKWRLIPLSEDAKEALKSFDMTQEYLLPRYHKDSIKTRFKRVCERAGIAHGKHGVHCLRHTFASHLVMAGRPLSLIQKLLGHASIKTTEQYAHLAPDYLADSMKDFQI